MRNLKKLLYFQEVAEKRSFTAAADSLDTQRSTVSIMIKELEEYYGAKLFERTTRKVYLTVPGEILLAACQQTQLNLQGAFEAIQQHTESPAGKLTLSIPESLNCQWFTEYIAFIKKKLPKLTLTLDIRDEKASFSEKNIDFASRIGVEDNSDLIFRNLANMQHALVATSDYLSKSSKLTAPKDLENHSLLTHKLLRSWKLEKKNSTDTYQFLPLSSFESTSFPFLYQLALQGFGITWLPKCYIAEDLIQGKIVEVLTDWEIKDAKNIPIEERNSEELSHVEGIDENNEIKKVLIYPNKSKSLNLAFDVTPAKYITGLITEKGISEASYSSLKKLFK